MSIMTKAALSASRMPRIAGRYAGGAQRKRIHWLEYEYYPKVIELVEGPLPVIYRIGC